MKQIYENHNATTGCPEYDVVYLTGAPAAGKSSVAERLKLTVSPIAGSNGPGGGTSDSRSVMELVELRDDQRRRAGHPYSIAPPALGIERFDLMRSCR